MATIKFRGVYTALVTPFKNHGKEVDWEAYEKLVLRQIAAGVAGIVAVGTTGESPTLSTEEAQKAISEAVRLGKGKVQVIAGTGSNDTAHTVEMTAWAKAAGADACLVVNPYYNRPSQAGLIAHMTAVAAVGLPIMLYNIPGRSGVAMTPATITTLASVPGIVAIKDATGGLDTASDVSIAAPGLTQLSGDDGLTVPFMSIGCTGVVSVLSNIVPERVVAMVDAALRGDFTAAAAAHRALLPLTKALFVETNPVPAKAALALLGLCHAAVRLPLVNLTRESDAKLRAALEAAEVGPLQHLHAHGGPDAA